jgi:hypothetical protein
MFNVGNRDRSMNYLECGCSHRHAGEEQEIQRQSSARPQKPPHTEALMWWGRFNVGGVLLNAPPTSCPGRCG